MGDRIHPRHDTHHTHPIRTLAVTGTGRSAGRARPVLAVLLGVVILCTVAACGNAPTVDPAARGATATAGAAATSTASAEATRTAQPVLLTAQVTQRGTVAEHNVQLFVTVSVTNQTN